MDLEVVLESSQGSQSLCRVGACTGAFLSNCRSSVTLPFAWIKGSVAFPRGFPTRLSHEPFPRGFPTSLSHEAFPRAFPTGLSHVPPWCESILGLKVEAVQGKQVSLEWTETLGDSGNGGTTLEFLSPFLWRAPPLEIRWERREFLPDHAGKDPSCRTRRRNRGSSVCGRDSRASSPLETGMSGSFLSCSKVVKDPLEVPQVRCD